MNQNMWCRFFRQHKYVVHKEEYKYDKKGNVIGKIIVSRCTNCGKIKCNIVYTEEGYGRY